jgi:hypothetical protein
MSLPKVFPAALRLDLLLALHLVAPWYLLLFFQCCFYLVDSAIPIAFHHTVNTSIPAATSYFSTFSATELSLWVAALPTLSLCAVILAKRLRSEARKEQSKAEERQKRNEGLSQWQIKLEAAKLWHGQGKEWAAQQTACRHVGIGVGTLKRMLDRAFIKYNSEHESKPLATIEAFRIVKWTVFESYLSPAEMGRGDTLSDWEFNEIKTRYEQRSRSFKDAPQSGLKKDSEEDDFAAVINEVFAESRSGKKKNRAEVTLQLSFGFDSSHLF